MSHERQVSFHNIPKREYEAVSIEIFQEPFNLEKFRNSLWLNENYKKRLYLLKITNPEKNQTTLYAYDWFESKKSLEQLIQTSDSEEIARVEAEMDSLENRITPESKEKIKKIISLYGYRHNYASRMHKAKRLGWIGALPGAVAGLFVGWLLLGLFSLIASTALGLMLSSLLTFFILIIPAGLGLGLGFFVGSLIASAAAALYHYWEKTSVPVNSNVVDNPDVSSRILKSDRYIQNSEQNKEGSVLQASYTPLLAPRSSVIENPGIDINDTPTSLRDFIQKTI